MKNISAFLKLNLDSEAKEQKPNTLLPIFYSQRYVKIFKFAESETKHLFVWIFNYFQKK
jgi:hypothetical protein